MREPDANARSRAFRLPPFIYISLADVILPGL
jgi:hypothetical protein